MWILGERGLNFSESLFISHMNVCMYMYIYDLLVIC